jgi:transposase
MTTAEIGALLGCHRDTVTLWLERYQALGVPGLQDEPRSGRPPALDPPTRVHLEEVLEHSPPETDRPCSRWTIPRLRTLLLQVTSRVCGAETLRRTVYKLGFRWRRPRLWARKEDPASFEKQLLVETARTAAAENRGVHFLYADASDQTLLGVIRSMWMRRGQQVRVATPPNNGRWTVFGALNAHTGGFVWQAYSSAITATFLAFLEHLLTIYPQGWILLTVDNAAYHTSKATVAWLKEHPRLLLLYLPARRPDLNPVEALWRGLKEAIAANRSFGNLLALGGFIRGHFAGLSPEALLKQAGLRKDFVEAT